MTFTRYSPSGNVLGSMHQIPSVSSSSGRPICSTSFRDIWMMDAPVKQVMPAISIECQRAPLRMT